MPSTIVEGSLTRLVGCTSMLSMMCRFAFPQGWGRLTRLLLPVVALRVQCPLPRCLVLPRILCLDSVSIVKPPIALLLGEALLALVTRMMSSIMVLDLSISLLFWQNSAQAVLLGFSWRKFWAYASDWDQALPHLPPDASAVVFVNGANVQSWDIWAGGVRQAFLPRGDHARIDRLLGKRGVLFDRHSLPAEDLLSKSAAARRRLSAKHCSWDECLALYQWVMRGAAS